MDWTKVFEVAAAFATLLAAIYGFTRFIDWRIERKIHEDSFLRRLGASLRPTVIFDENGSILVDQGAMQELETIRVIPSSGGDNLPQEIVIRPKRHLAHAPLLQTLENELIDVVVTRGQGLEWRYRLDYQMSNDAFDGKRRFRLEILA